MFEDLISDTYLLVKFFSDSKNLIFHEKMIKYEKSNI